MSELIARLRAALPGKELKLKTKAEFQHLRHEAKTRAEGLLDAAQKEGRDLNAEEGLEYGQLVQFMQKCNAGIDYKDNPSGRRSPRSPYKFEPATPLNVGGAGGAGEGDIASGLFSETAQFIQNGNGGYQASLNEGGNLQYAVPGWEVESFIAAYPTNAPFDEAGATQFDTPDAHQINVPIVVTGDDPAVYAENAGPTTDESASVYVAKLFAHKRAFLTKLSEEVVQDITTLEATITTEGIRRVYRAVSNAVTDALVASLSAANATVPYTGDLLDALLDLEAALDPTWAGQNNVLMMDQSSLSKFRGLRDNQNRPIFDPTAKTLLGYKVVINQRLHGRVIFGAFRPGVYIRQTPIIVQRLIELYSEAGQVGIRFQRRSDQAFFSDAATASQAPQPLWLLSTDVGS